jgi:hypothetical protein
MSTSLQTMLLNILLLNIREILLLNIRPLIQLLIRVPLRI